MLMGFTPPFLLSRHHLGCGHPGRVSDEPQEVHPRHEDGVRRAQEEEGPGRPHRLPPRGHQVEVANLDVGDSERRPIQV